MDGVAGVLETALYYPHARREEVLAFYEQTLGLSRVAGWDSGRAYRIGTGVVLLFDRELLAEQEGPVSAHGAVGPGHVCLVADPGRYGELRGRLEERGVEVTHEHEWPRGGRSFYFADPANNLLEIADSDIWPADA